MLFVIVPLTTKDALSQALQNIHASQTQIEGIELRLDYYPELNQHFLMALQQQVLSLPFPCIVTLRSTKDGGLYRGPEHTRRTLLRHCASLWKPTYIDLEASLPKAWLRFFKKQHPSIKIILSVHRFQPQSLSLHQLQRRYKKTTKKHPAHYIKIALMGKNTLDTLSFLLFMKKNAKGKLIGICLGEYGQPSRILGPLFKSPITYATLEEADSSLSHAAPLSMSSLVHTYHYHRLNPHTRLFGLIGSPIQHSLGPTFHNHLFQEKKINAVYLLFPLTHSQLPKAMSLFKTLNVQGLSVTTPLKTAIIPTLSSLDPAIKTIHAVNTVTRQHGSNTDGIGVHKALCEKGYWPLSGRENTIVFIGASATSKAIIHALLEPTLTIIVLNRSIDKAHQLNQSFEHRLKIYPLDALNEASLFHYSLLFHCVPADSLLPFSPQTFIPNSLILQMAYPIPSALIQEAQKQGCPTLMGQELYPYQARQQWEDWGL
jgi:3-dehydroquinate dehydratase / shikimate dehydrogenase